MPHFHDQYGKAVLSRAFLNEFDANPAKVFFKANSSDAGSATIDGLIGDDIAVEVESRASKQVRGALVDLAFHPRKGKLMVLMRKYGNSYTAEQCRVILERLCPDARFSVIEINGSGDNPTKHLSGDTEIVRRAVRDLRGFLKK